MLRSELVARTSPQVKTSITVVRIAVARLESTSFTPTFARIAVAPAKSAESIAQTNQLLVMSNDDLSYSYFLIFAVTGPGFDTLILVAVLPLFGPLV